MAALRLPLAALILMGLAYLPTAHGEQYASLGVSRDAIQEMLASEGLNPKTNNYPDLDGHKVTEFMVNNPLVMITMYGPDENLNTIEMTTRQTTDETENYYQGLLVLWLLNTVFPDWASGHMWFKRSIDSISKGTAKGKVKVTRNGIQAEVDAGFGHVYFNLVGLPVDSVATAN